MAAISCTEGAGRLLRVLGLAGGGGLLAQQACRQIPRHNTPLPTHLPFLTPTHSSPLKGKTLGFGLPMLAHIAAQREAGVVGSGKGPFAMVMAPTRELALQINQVGWRHCV